MQAILHIPHAAVTIPDEYQETYLGGQARISNEHLKLSDLHTDRLFTSPGIAALPLVFPYSRIFVDVERFRDANDEIMAARGMGACIRTAMSWSGYVPCQAQRNRKHCCCAIMTRTMLN